MERFFIESQLPAYYLAQSFLKKFHPGKTYFFELRDITAEQFGHAQGLKYMKIVSVNFCWPDRFPAVKKILEQYRHLLHQEGAIFLLNLSNDESGRVDGLRHDIDSAQPRGTPSERIRMRVSSTPSSFRNHIEAARQLNLRVTLIATP